MSVESDWQKDNIKCKDIDYGTYECTYAIYLPWLCKFPWEKDERRAKLVNIDKCLLPEIIDLWEKGIKTTGCCCGHGKHDPFILVVNDDIQKMKDLGYIPMRNSCRSNDRDMFFSKTDISYGTAKCTEV